MVTAEIYDTLSGAQGSDITSPKTTLAMQWNSSGATGSVQYVMFRLKRQGSATGSCKAAVWDGNVVLAESQTQDVSTWDTSFADIEFDLQECVTMQDGYRIGIIYSQTSSDPNMINTEGNRTATPPSSVNGLEYKDGSSWSWYDTANKGYMNGTFDNQPGSECGSGPSSAGTRLPPPPAFVRI